ncbi:MAG: DUF2487 family protein [Bacilli bacterium]
MNVRWTKEHLEIIQQNRTYIDTVLLPVALCDVRNMSVSAEKFHYLDKWVSRLETTYQGRVLKMPTILLPDDASLNEQVNKWITLLQDDGFAHVFPVTVSEPYEASRLSPLHVVPYVSLEGYRQEEQEAIVSGQVNQWAPFIEKMWTVER